MKLIITNNEGEEWAVLTDLQLGSLDGQPLTFWGHDEQCGEDLTVDTVLHESRAWPQGDWTS